MCIQQILLTLFVSLYYSTFLSSLLLSISWWWRRSYWLYLETSKTMLVRKLDGLISHQQTIITLCFYRCDRNFVSCRVTWHHYASLLWYYVMTFYLKIFMNSQKKIGWNYFDSYVERVVVFYDNGSKWKMGWNLTCPLWTMKKIVVEWKFVLGLGECLEMCIQLTMWKIIKYWWSCVL